MDKDEIKRRVSIEQILVHHGRTPVAGKKMQCLLYERHNNLDANPSMDTFGDRIFCRAQKCFGDRGSDIYEVVGLMESLPTFREQKAWLETTFGLNHGKPKQANILRVYEWTDAKGRVAYHLRIDDEK